MNFLERNLEDIIYNTSNEDLQSRGLDINGKKKRQLRIGKYGICDLITYRRTFWDTLEIVIYELKKDKINFETFKQVLNYYKGILHYLRDRNFSQSVEVKIVLIGIHIDTQDSFVFLPDLTTKIRLLTYTYNFDGIKFENKRGYSIIDPF